MDNLKIDPQTSFLKVICQYLYLGRNKQQRLPHDLQEYLSSQEFRTTIENLLDSVDVVFNEDIDWSILLQAFETLKREYPDRKIRLKAVESSSNYRFVVKIKIYPHNDLENIIQYFRDRYQLLALTKNNLTSVKTTKHQIDLKDLTQDKLNFYQQN